MAQKIDAPTEKIAELSVEDRVEISQIISDYNVYLAAGNAEAYAALYTIDGTFFSEGREAITGRDNLLEFIKQRRTKPEVKGRTQWASNIVIRATAEGAQAESYQMIVEQGTDGNRIRGIHVKVDELRRENGRWRFLSRRNVPLGDK